MMKGKYAMKFCDKEIQEELSKGGKVYRKFWSTSTWLKFIYIDRKDKSIRANDGSNYTVNYWDLNSDDWKILEDNEDNIENKYNQKKIIDEHILCVFWDDDMAHEFTQYRIGRLLSIDYVDNTWKYIAEFVEFNGYEQKVYTDSFKHYKPIELKDYNVMNNEQDYLK